MIKVRDKLRDPIDYKKLKERLEKIFGEEGANIIIRAYRENRLKETFGDSVARVLELIILGKYKPSVDWRDRDE